MSSQRRWQTPKSLFAFNGGKARAFKSCCYARYCDFCAVPPMNPTEEFLPR